MMHLYMYIYTLAIGIEEKGQVYLGKKVFARLVLPGKTSIRVTSLMVSRIFQMSRFYR